MVFGNPLGVLYIFLFYRSVGLMSCDDKDTVLSLTNLLLQTTPYSFA